MPAPVDVVVFGLVHSAGEEEVGRALRGTAQLLSPGGMLMMHGVRGKRAVTEAFFQKRRQ